MSGKSSAVSAFPEGLTQELYKLIQSVQFGSIEIIIHNNVVVQLEKHEKFRLSPPHHADHHSSTT